MNDGGPSAENVTSRIKKKIDKLPLKVPPFIIIPRLNDNDMYYRKRKRRFYIVVYP